MSTGRITLAPALCSAGGIIVGTLIAVSTMDRAWPAPLLGPLLLAVSVLGTDILTARAQGLRRLPSRTAAFLAAASLVALAMVAFGNPDTVPMLLPVIGGGMSSPLLGSKPRRQSPAESASSHPRDK